MEPNMPTRVTYDYSLTGDASQKAQQQGLVSATWYQTDIPRKTMKALMKRSDAPAIRDTAIWFIALFVFAGMINFAWGTWWVAPLFFIYALLYGTASDSRWHECSHGTAFKTPWMNSVVYYIASFMVIREPKIWKWSHARHHTDTIVVGRDYEIMGRRPTRVLRHILALFGLPQTWGTLKSLTRHALGRLSTDENSFVPASEYKSIFQTARLMLILYVVIIATAVYFRSWYFAMMIGPLPAMAGVWLAYIFGLTQHAGLAENVLDHRQNCRTIYMNPVMRFLYWNMNYHTEHHMFPMVPYHQLPQLHQLMKGDCPPVYPSTWSALKEVVSAMWRQRKDPNYSIKRENF
ncbi:fatty acid desaturase [Marinomonas sp. CT5]|nr:fatty acid desaturase [Marinomonas sp. CT5]